jgi:beta-xylosidase
VGRGLGRTAAKRRLQSHTTRSVSLPNGSAISNICLVTGRETFLFPVTWEDGWPVFNGGEPLSEHLEGVLKDKSPLAAYFNDFTSHALDLAFYFIRTPYKKFYSLVARPGFLRLNANSFALGDRDNPALLLRKQTSYNETFETELEFAAPTNLTEAGVTIFYSDLLHNDIGIVGDGQGGRQIVTRTNVQAAQVGPWAIVYTNSTITTVRSLPPHRISPNFST